ncbi:MAG: PEP/pyruvate-binding domain-containing protein, partial [Anaerolineae bacterium]
MTELTRVLWLEEIGKEDLPVVGGKGANLGEMIRAGFPVPPGFCLTTAAYQEFLTENSLEEGVERIRLCLTDRARLEEEAGHMQSLIKAGKFSTVARQEILTAYRRLLTKGVPQGLVAVRSSAVGEDLAEASFAGQQETVLNVADATELLDAIRSCWASLWTVRAVHYRQDQWQETIGPTMAVVVQAMIPSQGAGVAFSADPLTGEEVIVIEAAWGLGQGVVAGEVEADHYRVSKEALEEVGSAFVGNKRWQRVWHPGAGPGTVLVEVPPADRERPVLNATQVKELAGLVRALDQYFGCPQDVEWGLWNGKFYLFQTRPVTGRPSGFFTERIAGDDHLWTSGFFNERFPQPVSPLGWSLIRELVE